MGKPSRIKYKERQPLKGSKVWNAILNENAVYDARIAYYQNGESLINIAKKYGMGLTAMRHAIIGETWRHVIMPVKTEPFSVSKNYKNYSNYSLSPGEVNEIRNGFNNGASIKDLALKHNLSRDCVYKIVYGITYQHYIGPIAKKIYEVEETPTC